ncbi:MAG: putative carbon-nitrogen hydrolase [Actinomycetia bacterium]|nr:putative carbon-nitrogen hydrolase [Actinomycetes bacterium]
MKVAAIQHDICWEDRDATLARLEPMVAAAAAGGARLVVLTEMFAVGFSMAPERVAEPEGGPTEAWLVDRAAAHDTWLAGSIPQTTGGRPRNVLVLAGPDGTVHRYAKVHPFTYSGEHEHYDAGNELVTVEVDGVRVSLFVCYDLRFADELWGLAPTTDVYVVVANWPAKRRQHWRSLLVARAIENQAYVVGCNRVGTGDGIDYAGDSCIVDPLGEAQWAEPSVEATLVAEVDPDVVAQVRERFPFLRDRR